MLKDKNLRFLLISHDQRYDFDLFDLSLFPPIVPQGGLPFAPDDFMGVGDSSPPAPVNTLGTSGPLVSGVVASEFDSALPCRLNARFIIQR